MDHGMRQVNKKWNLPVLPDKCDGLLGISFCQRFLFGRRFNNFLIAHQGKRYAAWHKFLINDIPIHVVTVRYAKVIIEALAGRQKFRLVTQVPFADTCCLVTLPLQYLCNCNFIRV